MAVDRSIFNHGIKTIIAPGRRVWSQPFSSSQPILIIT
jgi:hypothetical protein